MLIEEIIDEYRTTRSYDPMGHVRAGDRKKKELRVVQTPMTDLEVRYEREGDYHDYYLYSKETGKCIGLFTIENTRDKLKVVAPGIRAVTPHMALAPVAQRKGISTRAYTTFLRGGPWVFVTDEHTDAASKLWNSIAVGDIVSFYVNEVTGKPVKTPGYHDLRVMGPKSRFKTIG